VGASSLSALAVLEVTLHWLPVRSLLSLGRSVLLELQLLLLSEALEDILYSICT
jgi:hypothetical protein